MPEQQLFVVCRTLKTSGQLLTAGDLLTQEELESFKYHKILMDERRIKPLPTDEQELQDLTDYFQVRWGVDFAANLAARVSKGSSSAEPEKPGASASPPTPGTSQGPGAAGQVPSVPPNAAAAGNVPLGPSMTIPAGTVVKPLTGTPLKR